jgi:hypothetical protein
MRSLTVDNRVKHTTHCTNALHIIASMYISLYHTALNPFDHPYMDNYVKRLVMQAPLQYLAIEKAILGLGIEVKGHDQFILLFLLSQ